jgi:hypothetical protein
MHILKISNFENFFEIRTLRPVEILLTGDHQCGGSPVDVILPIKKTKHQPKQIKNKFLCFH